MKKLLVTLALASVLTGPVVAATVPVGGEVKKINTEQGKITIKHEAIANLDMKPMTMVFNVADPAMLDSVKVGDKVTFEADRVKGKITLISIKAAD